MICMLCVPKVPSQFAGWRDGALSGPEAGNRSAEEETGRAGRETHCQNPGAVQVSSVKKVVLISKGANWNKLTSHQLRM